MSLEERYETSEDAQQQLAYAVVMSKKGPVYLNPEDGWMFVIRPVGGGDGYIEDIREIGLTFDPIELGYVYFRGDAVYLTRKPKRMWKAGITEENTSATGGWVDQALLTSHGMLECINGVYPTLEAAFNESRNSSLTIPFSRHFAISGDDRGESLLMYRGEVIGSVDKENNLLVDNKFLFLKEQLEELCQKV